MKISSILAATAGLPLAAAFQNTSPFIVASTVDLSIPILSRVQTASKVLEVVVPAFEQCPTTNYLILSHRGVTIDDLSQATTPFLSEVVDEMASSTVISELFGRFDIETLARSIEKACNGKSQTVNENGHFADSDSTVRILKWTLDATRLSGPARASRLKYHDTAIKTLLSKFPRDEGMTIIYTTSSDSSKDLGAHELSGNQLDRDESADPIQFRIQGRDEKDKSESPLPSPTSTPTSAPSPTAPLKPGLQGSFFDRYAFFSPPIGPVMFVMFTLLFILYFGISNVASIESSDFAMSQTAIEASKARDKRQKFIQKG